MSDDNNHGRGAEPEEPLTPAGTATPSHAERARTLVRGQKSATLCTLSSAEPVGYPYGSLTTFALEGGNPVFLVSQLATHTKNLEADPRASLMVAEESEDDPLASGRVTLVGECKRLEEDEAARATFLKRHESARYYVDFKDFSFFQLAVASVRYIGGYGRMSWVDLAAWQNAEADPLGESARGILDHMNEDHADAVLSYTHAFTRAKEATKAVMVGIDRYGFELSVTTDKGPRPARIAFENEITTPTEARQALVALVGAARKQLSPA